jgi:hypothetical protein
MPTPEGTNEIVAAILAAAWFQKEGLDQGARNREQFIKEYRAMLAIVKRADQEEDAA